MARLVDLFESAKAVDEAVSRINGSAPPGEHRRLLRVELTARSLEGFSTADRPIAKAVDCPTGRTALGWPGHRHGRSTPACFAPVAFDRRLSADWWQVQEEGRAMRE
jgi:hypothetical protein